METQTGISFIPSTPMTDDDMAAVEQDYRDRKAARWCAMPTPEQTRIRKQNAAIAAADAFALANPLQCDDCRRGNHARCVPTSDCACCQRRAA